MAPATHTEVSRWSINLFRTRHPSNVPVEALTRHRFMQVTLPAFPIVNAMRLMASIETPVSQQNASYPHALLCGIIGHSITYEPEVRLLFGTVWKDAVAAEDEEYKAPRLQTLHLALISLATRPSQAHAVNAMSLARSVAIAHILGLHLDCAGWSLPRWEKSVRKRAWWALIVLDKWFVSAACPRARCISI